MFRPLNAYNPLSLSLSLSDSPFNSVLWNECAARYNAFAPLTSRTGRQTGRRWIEAKLSRRDNRSRAAAANDASQPATGLCTQLLPLVGLRLFSLESLARFIGYDTHLTTDGKGHATTCSARWRYTNSSVMHHSSTHGIIHWIVCATLYLNRKWPDSHSDMYTGVCTSSASRTKQFKLKVWTGVG